MQAEPNDKPSTPRASRKHATARGSTGSMGRWRLWCFRLTAIFLIPLFLFGGIEVCLGILSDQTPMRFLVPLESNPQLLVDNYKSMWQFFPKALARTPQPLATTATKANGTKRIVIFGGSAAMGDPEPAYGLPRTLDMLLSARFPNEKFDVVNAAITAVNSHVVRTVASDCRQLDADAWVVYMGNNEVHGPFGAGTVFGGNNTPLPLIRFGLLFKRSATGQFLASLRSTDKSSSAVKSWGGMKMFLDHQIRHDDPQLERVYANYQANLKAIIRMAARDRVPLVLSTMVTNLADCAPFISRHQPDLSASDLEKWEAEFDQGKAYLQSGEFENAIRSFQAALQIDPDFAELQFRLAKCYQASGNEKEAIACFVKARDLDCLRFRADSRINEMIRATAESRANAVFFVDSEKELAKLSLEGILGDEFLYEHVHFNFRGNYEIAKQLGAQIVTALNLSGGSDEWISEDGCGQQLGLTAYHRNLTVQEMRNRLLSAPFDAQSNAQERQAKLEKVSLELKSRMTKEAADREIEHFRKLLTERPNDWLLKRQFGLLLESMGRLPETIELWRSITDQLPHYAEGHYQLGVFLNRAKKWSAAEQPLRRALAIRAEFARASNSLGICLSHLGKVDESYQQFANAVAVQPTFAEAYVNWGLVLANQKKTEAAIQKYHVAIDVDPTYLAAHVRLANHYRAKKDFQSLRVHYEAISRQLPKNVAAQINFGMVLLRLNQTEDAKLQFEKVLALDPNNRIAKSAMADLAQH